MASNELDCWKTDQYIEEYIELMNFLIERTKDVESPLSINQLAKEFKQKSGSSQTISCLFYRIRTLREKAAELDTIDTATKVRMMFALSAPIDEEFLKELRVDSHVEVDGKNRITEYKANDGRLEFEGDHSGSAKRRSRSKKMVSEKSQNDSHDKSMDPIPKTPGSVKRSGPEVPNSSKRAKDSSPAGSMESEDHAPEDSAGIPESRARKLVCRFSPNAPSSRVQQLLQPEKQSKTRSDKSQKDSDDGSQDSMLKTPGSVQRSAPEVPNSSKTAKKQSFEDSVDGSQDSMLKTPGSMKKGAAEVPNSSKRVKDSSPAGSMKSKDHAPNDSARIPESGAREPPNPKTPNSGSLLLRQSKLEGASKALPHKETSNLKNRGGPKASGDSMNDFDDGSQENVPKTPGSVKRPAAELSNSSKRAKDSSSARSMNTEDDAPNDSARIPESEAREPSNPEVQQLHQLKKQEKQVKEKSQDDSADRSMNPVPKNPESVKRAAAAEVTNTSKKTKEIEDHAPEDSARIPESGAREPNPGIQQQKMVTEKSQEDYEDGSQESVSKTPGSMKRAAAAEVPNISKRVKNSTSARSMKPEDHAPNDSAGIPESGARELPNPGIQSPRQPFPETPRARTRQEAPGLRGAPRTPGDEIPQEKPIKTEPEADGAYTSRIKLLEAIQSLVLSLDMPSLSPLLTRIEKKLRELSSNEKIPNDEMVAALELLVVKITNDSVSNLPETVESVSLSHFLCYLKSLIFNSKLEGLENLLEKIKRRIKEPSTKDKMIPVEKVTSTLQPILDVIGF